MTKEQLEEALLSVFEIGKELGYIHGRRLLCGGGHKERFEDVVEGTLAVHSQLGSTLAQEILNAIAPVDANDDNQRYLHGYLDGHQKARHQAVEIVNKYFGEK